MTEHRRASAGHDPSPDDKNGQTKPRVVRIEQVVAVVDVVDVALIGVGPIRRPDIDDLKPVARVLETWPVINDDRTVDHKGVLTAEARSELLLWNSSTAISGSRWSTAGLLATLPVLALVLLGSSGLLFLGFSILLLCLSSVVLRVFTLFVLLLLFLLFLFLLRSTFFPSLLRSRHLPLRRLRLLGPRRSRWLRLPLVLRFGVFLLLLLGITGNGIPEQQK